MENSFGELKAKFSEIYEMMISLERGQKETDVVALKKIEDVCVQILETNSRLIDDLEQIKEQNNTIAKQNENILKALECQDRDSVKTTGDVPVIDMSELEESPLISIEKKEVSREEIVELKQKTEKAEIVLEEKTTETFAPKQEQSQEKLSEEIVSVREQKTQKKEEASAQPEVARKTGEIEQSVSKDVEKPTEKAEKEEIENLQTIETTERVSSPEKKETSSVLEFLHNRVIKDKPLQTIQTESGTRPQTTSEHLGSLLKQQSRTTDSNNAANRVEKEETTIGAQMDLFAERPKSISDKFESQSNNNLHVAIGVNFKFMFINDLFLGDIGSYNGFIDELNKAKTMEESMIMVDKKRSAYKWAVSSPAYCNLMDIIKKRFD